MERKALLLSLIAFYTFLVTPLAPVLAQELELSPDVDRTAPLIQHEPPSQSVPAGKDLVIQATITDNVAVKEAILYYRSMGNVEYFSTNMNPIGNNLYTAPIPKQDVLEPGIEYYIQASDKAGNMVMRGFSFSPLVIAVAPVFPGPGGEKGKEQPVVAVPPTTPAEELGLKTQEPATPAWYKKWWVWTIVGVVVIGIAAAAGGGGGGGGGGSNAPSTGSVTITGPVP